MLVHSDHIDRTPIIFFTGKDNSRVAVLQCCSSKIDSAIVKIELYI